ncbi:MULTISPECIES: DUF2891 domain-containing protein [Weeksella]|uniref:DUF2891 domain-containing protein n=1 Tax=Weeksella virosa (strain ATCC 43766 / DSM 16922 / JCM 21250 / CCUG 30538 / CDC 9751 / IAM 14551 / NBRC 16016 / NCTC 11634 / CL345/78) TaxID=865938 RepID=F0P2Z2_WEEVC|nr:MULTISPECIES: DUF2891 domain-containing protein [Weeksella]ADX67904.1 hypothetical protein Weevi_1195 [Weeksella virosa DSM 16922]MDK7374194.1 DUF2891 domain-containing protein [Weeksella virosa]OFM82868.1 hypothetical protein HMPREF2660_04255 [Weeksella sp. HMSC059D05]SUP54207.1 Protein of uncharacterised function (DUF2891) [Weeksella virosa]VEH64469.1 Protein of uncharacterised function (DUF2891) [Weeksella virosa]
MKKILFITTLLSISSFAQELHLEQAKKIFELPTNCITIEYPNKLGNVLGSEQDLKTPKQLRPIFYGCFDWHSSVHGFWSIVKLMKDFPELDENNSVRILLNQLITPENVRIEKAFFEDRNNRNFERTYGWAWLLQLQMELNTWQDSDAQKWAKNLQPLTELIVAKYKEYLPKLVYPVRTGTHDNTAFGLSLAIDYARSLNDKAFEQAIIENANRLYLKDKGCNLGFEPSGSDFLSACLEEALLMSKITPTKEYKTWLKDFLPQLFDKKHELKPGIVSDRTDGQLVHLDGLNFSRATALYQIAYKLPELNYLNSWADHHFNYSFNNISNDDYMGSHWLGTFALYALKTKQELKSK